MRFPALQSRNFCIYEGGSLFALNGQWITRIVVGWVGWELTGSATWVGLLSFFLFAPTIVTSPFFGVLVDRVHLKPTVIVSQGIVTLATLSLYILHLAGLLNVWSLSAVSLVIGVAGSAERAVRVTIVPRMVPLSALTNAVGIHATNFNVARLIGPAIGGIMIEHVGTGPTMLVNFIVLVPFMVALFFLKVSERDGSNIRHKSFFADFWSGAKVAARHPVIREAMMLTCITSITVRGVLDILPALADGEFPTAVRRGSGRWSPSAAPARWSRPWWSPSATRGSARASRWSARSRCSSAPSRWRRSASSIPGRWRSSSSPSAASPAP